MRRLSEEIENIFNKTQLEEIQIIVNDFKSMELLDFYNKYNNKLDLENCEWIKEFMDIADQAYIYIPFATSYKNDYLDLLICWIMFQYDLAFMVTESELKESYEIIGQIGHMLNSQKLNNFFVKDKFGRKTLLNSIIEDVNIQLEKENLKFIRLNVPNLVDTYYFFLFNTELADKLINFYKNELFSFTKITSDKYTASIYIDRQIKENYFYFNYKKEIENEIHDAIEILLEQKIKNFLIPCSSDIDLFILKLFNKFSKKYSDIKVTCCLLADYKDNKIKNLLNAYKFVEIKDYINVDTKICFDMIYKNSSYIIQISYMEGYGITKVPIFKNSTNEEICFI